MSKSAFTKQYKTFCSLLIEARTSANLTQMHVAKKLARPQSYVSKYENGERRLDVVEFLSVAKAVGVDPCSILRQVTSSQNTPK